MQRATWGHPLHPSTNSLRSRALVPIRILRSKARRKTTSVRYASAAIIVSSNKILICQREENGEEPGKWQFPGGEIDPGESPRQALYRELREELGVDSVRARYMDHLQAVVGDFETDVHFFLVDGYRGVITANEGQLLRWVDIDEIDSYDLLKPNREILARQTSVWDTAWLTDDRHYASLKVRTERVRAKLVQSSKVGLQMPPPGVCVDVGAGSFSVAELIGNARFEHSSHGATECIDRVELSRVISVERSSVAIQEFGVRLRGRTDIIQADAVNLPLEDGLADTVIAFNIIEHIPDYGASVAEMARILKPTGSLFLCHSNRRSIIFVERYFKAVRGKWIYGFQLNLSPSKLIALLREHGLQVEEWRVDPPGPDRPILRRIDQLIGRANLTWGRNITVRAIKLVDS